jgi:hypothetical protein
LNDGKDRDTKSIPVSINRIFYAGCLDRVARLLRPLAKEKMEGIIMIGYLHINLYNEATQESLMRWAVIKKTQVTYRFEALGEPCHE